MSKYRPVFRRNTADAVNAVLDLGSGLSVEIVAVGQRRAYVWVGGPAGGGVVGNTTVNALRAILAAHDTRLRRSRNARSTVQENRE